MPRQAHLILGLVFVYAVAPIAAHAQSAASPARPVTAVSSVPRSIPFTGQAVTAAGDAQQGTALLTFGLYTDQTDGTPLWTEQQLVAFDASGRYSVILGSASAEGLPADAFAAGTPKWLGVRVGGDPEQPRFMLLSVPYALKASDADTVGGKPVTELVTTSHLTDSVKSAMKETTTASTNAPTVTTNALVKYSNSGGSTTESSLIDAFGHLAIGVSQSTLLSDNTELDILGAGSTATITMHNGGSAADVVKLVGSDGSLRIGSATNANLINLIGPNVGIGITNPSSKLHVAGSLTAGDSVMHSLFINTTAGIAMDAETTSGGEAVYAECVQSGNNCYSLEGYAPTGDYALYAYGGKGAYLESDDSAKPGVDGAAYGTTSYGVSGESSAYRGGYFKSDSNVLYSLYVDDVDGPTQGTAALNVHGTIRGEGNLVIGGSKAGYVVDLMQNVDSSSLEAGDVVIIVGNAAPVLGEIPVVTVKKASAAYDGAVAGIVDQVWYAPSAATKTAYEAQENAMREARAARNEARQAVRGLKKVKPQEVKMPEMTITDGEGTLHIIPDATSVPTGGYASVVTLGSYKMLKADASFGAIHPGDMLTTSAHAGYAMKATDKVAAIGAVIGKALGGLDNGTGTIPVLVTLK